jgi:hypothetical protein
MGRTHGPYRRARLASGLGRFAWWFFVSHDLVGLVLVGAGFTVKGKIWGVRAVQHPLFSPSIDKRVHHATDEYQHANRNQ